MKGDYISFDGEQGAISIKSNRNYAIEFGETKVCINGKELDPIESYEWFNAAIEEKAKRIPDKETGLVPCGCGGEARLDSDECDYWGMPSSTEYIIVCESCGMQTKEYEEEQQLINAWNTAMGYKGGPT